MSNIKLIIFDLDGVLIETKHLHFKALNQALGEYAFDWSEHLAVYDGLTTRQKLSLLSERKGIPVEQQRIIYGGKQLEDTKSLQEYGIAKKDSTVHLVLRLR